MRREIFLEARNEKKPEWNGMEFIVTRVHWSVSYLIHSVVVRRSGTSALRRAGKFTAGDCDNVERDEERVDEVDPPAPAVLRVVAANRFDARKNIHARGDEEEPPDVGMHELEDFSCARGFFSVLLVGSEEPTDHLEVGEDHDG